MRLRAIPTSVLFLAILCGCGGRSFDVGAEQKELLRRDGEWADLASAGQDLEKILSYWSDDAVVIEPHQPIYRGKAAIRAYVTESLKIAGFKIHWVSETPVFSPDGKLAYMPGANEVTVPAANGSLTTLHMRGVSIWRRDPDGQWRCVVDIANEAPGT